VANQTTVPWLGARAGHSFCRMSHTTSHLTREDEEHVNLRRVVDDVGEQMPPRRSPVP
jgi:hypothetical protein